MTYAVRVKYKDRMGNKKETFVSCDNTPTDSDEVKEFQSINGAVDWMQSEEAQTWLTLNDCKFEVIEMSI